MPYYYITDPNYAAGKNHDWFYSGVDRGKFAILSKVGGLIQWAVIDDFGNLVIVS